MAQELRLICTSGEVIESGTGFRFKVERDGREVPAFVIRYSGKVYAYYNECGHVPAQLDTLPGEFFDYSKLYLVCTIHGALYAPDTGRCRSGRCEGRGLKPLRVHEIDDLIFLEPENDNG